MNIKDLGNRAVLITERGQRHRPRACAAVRAASTGCGRGAR